MPRHGGAEAACEDGEAVVEVVGDFAEAEIRHACRSKLERKRDAVELMTDLRDRKCVLRCKSECRLRRRGAIPQVLEVERLLIDEEHGLAARGGQELALTSTELRLLAYLVRHRGQALSKDQLLTQVWGYDAYDHNLVEVHVSALRRKLEGHGPRLIHTVRGIGYRFSA